MLDTNSLFFLKRLIILVNSLNMPTDDEEHNTPLLESIKIPLLSLIQNPLTINNKPYYITGTQYS
jgi:hypothetical protein